VIEPVETTANPRGSDRLDTLDRRTCHRLVRAGANPLADMAAPHPAFVG